MIITSRDNQSQILRQGPASTKTTTVTSRFIEPVYRADDVRGDPLLDVLTGSAGLLTMHAVAPLGSQNLWQERITKER